jgi:hypothetical protein
MVIDRLTIDISSEYTMSFLLRNARLATRPVTAVPSRAFTNSSVRVLKEDDRSMSLIVIP